LWPNGLIDQDATWYEGRPRRRPYLLDGDPSPPPRKKGRNPDFRPISIVAKRLPISATAEHLFTKILTEITWLLFVAHGAVTSPW